MLRILAIAAITALAGCTTYTTGRYSTSTDNVMALRSSGAKAVNVGAFTATPDPGLSEVKCLSFQPVTTTDGQPFAEFMRKALVDEMRLAGTFSAAAPVTITGTLTSVSLVTTTAAQWDMAVTFRSSNGKTLAMTESYKFPWNYNGAAQCTGAAQAFVPAVQDLIGKFVTSPQFALLTTP